MDYGKILQSLIDLSKELNERSIEKASGLIQELEKEWYRLFDLADHFKYLGLWNDFDKLSKTMDNIDSVIWHFQNLFFN